MNRINVKTARAAVAPTPGIAWNNAPPPLQEWVGREHLLHTLTQDWLAPDRQVTGLIAAGGEGKSSLARRWVDHLFIDPTEALPDAPAKERDPRSTSQVVPDGVFWWSFDAHPSVETFFEAALSYLSGGRVDPRRLPSAHAQGQMIAAMLGIGRYLFVLDGLEAVQHQGGDQSGRVQSAALRELLTALTAPDCTSFCLITSRIPALDLSDLAAYVARDVPPLSLAEGRKLLAQMGVGDAQAPSRGDAMLDKLVIDWDGHALSLGLIGTYLASYHGGDAAHAEQIAPPAADEPRHTRTHRILRRYDERLTDAERATLTLFSAFRLPVQESALKQVLWGRVLKKPSLLGRLFGREPKTVVRAHGLNAPIAALDSDAWSALVERLVARRLLRHAPRKGTYTTHSLIRDHYRAHLAAIDRAQIKHAHEGIADYYLQRAGDVPYNPTLGDLQPAIEAVHHTCRAGDYDGAWRMLWATVRQKERYVLDQELCAYETALAILSDFFLQGDMDRYPQVSDPYAKRDILTSAGACLMNLGRPDRAIVYFTRGTETALKIQDWANASIGHLNIVGLQVHIGLLDAGKDTLQKAATLARLAQSERDECDGLTWQAWLAYLRGDIDTAGKTFRKALALERQIESGHHHLTALRGIQHADYLRRTGDWVSARLGTELNHALCERQRWFDNVSQCQRVLGDLYASAENHRKARAHYDQAVQIARSISVPHVLVEALLARGRWAARSALQSEPPSHPEPIEGYPSTGSGCLAEAALTDLNEALRYAVQGRYRLYEVDIRAALSWAHLAQGAVERARQEAQRARRMSLEMGYHWGRMDAEEAMNALAPAGL
jgi:tetratricopeptide (TPR) repeat protein